MLTWQRRKVKLNWQRCGTSRCSVSSEWNSLEVVKLNVYNFLKSFKAQRLFKKIRENQIDVDVLFVCIQVFQKEIHFSA